MHSDDVSVLYQKYGRYNQLPSNDELLGILAKLLEQEPQTFIILDALDECNDVKELMDILAKIRERDIPGARILATSREGLDIKRVMATLAVPIWLAPALVDKGVAIFLQREFRAQGSLSRWSGEGKDQQQAQQIIREAIVTGSKGM
jgi:hypothetical protein